MCTYSQKTENGKLNSSSTTVSFLQPSRLYGLVHCPVHVHELTTCLFGSGRCLLPSLSHHFGASGQGEEGELKGPDINCWGAAAPLCHTLAQPLISRYVVEIFFHYSA
uniref:Uncharacterized protein n=1 Tax=Rhipicephalus zambeziensis TaxID=60191 RepID=A0A224YAY2_9ACAR